MGNVWRGVMPALFRIGTSNMSDRKMSNAL